MIEWLARVPPGRVLVDTEGQSWTYGDVVEEVEHRRTDRVTTLWPGNDIEGVLDSLAGLAGGGAVLAGPGVDVPETPRMGADRLVMFTSGTTGPPKGVRLSGSNIEAACRASVSHLRHGEDDRWLVSLPLHHVGGLSAVLRSIYAGGSIRLMRRFDASAFATAMRDGATLVSVVPTMLRRILEHDSGPYEGLRAVLVGGGPIPGRLLERAREAGLPVLPTYGMTETLGQVATLRPGSPLGYRAHPLPGVDVRIEPDGRVSLRSQQISAGYLGEDDRANPWFTTNDLGALDDEGALVIEGRADVVLITGGENVNPEQVEAEVLGHRGVEQVVVVGVPDDDWGVLLTALYVGPATEDDLSSWMRARVPGFMVPKRWMSLASLPETGPGKPDRRLALGLALGLAADR